MSERIRIIKTFKNISKSAVALSGVLFLTSGCNNIAEVNQAESISRSVSNYADTGEALIYTDTPTQLSSQTYTYGSTSTSAFLSLVYSKNLEREFVTDNDLLETTCTFEQYISSSATSNETTSNKCFLVANSDTERDSAQSNSGSWKYDAGTDEFYQVNLYYHLNKILERYMESLQFAHKTVHFSSTNPKLPPATKYNFLDTDSYWLLQDGSIDTLKAYANTDMESINAFFSPATNTLSFGVNEEKYPTFRMVQDPTVIYHEFGHTLVKVMMNQRNVSSSFLGTDIHPYQSDLGAAFYDEAGAINEGIADFFSYYMNGRTQVGDWAFNVILGGYRPLTEDDDFHSADVSSNEGEKLSYPQYVYYNPNFTTENEEDVHNSGQIITHYLVSLTETLKTSCTFSSTDSNTIHEEATNYVFLLLNETLAELGDLTAKGSDFFSELAGTYNSNHETIFFTNLNSDQSFLWSHYINPPNFRKFARIFAKNIKHHISENLCSEFSVDNSEKLLDEYGLLLFKSYEDAGNGIDTLTNTILTFDSFDTSYPNEAFVFGGHILDPETSNNFVNEANRNNTTLVSKEYIEIDDEIPSILFDGQNEIASILANLTFEGQNVTTTAGIAGTEYNNNNIQIGPGEVVGLSINLFNNSNSAMGGVQLLANDWDHMRLKMDVDEVYDTDDTYVPRTTNKVGISAGTITGSLAQHEPCIFNNFPSASEGGVTDTTSTTDGNCSSTSKTNYQLDLATVISDTTYPKYELDAPQPICLVQYNDENETKWVSQDFFRRYELDLEDNDCLNNPTMSGNEFNPNECLIRFLPGASTAQYGRINSQSTWPDSIKEGTSNSVVYNSSSIVLMEVNKWIQPGTKFNCRFRVRHTNCSDCFNNSAGDEYGDYQYTGSLPFKVIDYQFTVLD